MKILYQIPSLDTIYAGRTIYNGYKNAFLDLGHQFETLTADDDMEQRFDEFQPDIFFTSLSAYYLKFLKLDIVKKHKNRGMKVFVNMPFWHSPVSKLRINESPSLSQNSEHINLIRSGNFGDVHYNVCESDDLRMAGFEAVIGYKHYTIPLAADKIILKSIFEEKFQADISFVGTYLATKKAFFKKNIFPLAKKYNLRIYGQDWTAVDRALGWVQRGGQYFNIPGLRSIRKPKLELGDEAKIYNSTLISLNIHEDYQKKFGGDCNERTFKIPFCDGFEITDDVACIRKYFKEGVEIVIAKNETEWFEKIDYYIKNPEKRLPIIEAGQKRVAAGHTYHNRVQQFINIYNQLHA